MHRRKYTGSLALGLGPFRAIAPYTSPSVWDPGATGRADLDKGAEAGCDKRVEQLTVASLPTKYRQTLVTGRVPISHGLP